MSLPLSNPTYRHELRQRNFLSVASWRNSDGLWSARIWALAAGNVFLVGEDAHSLSRSAAITNADPKQVWI